MLHGSFSYLIQDEEGQRNGSSRRSPRPTPIGPEHSFLKLAAAEYHAVTDAVLSRRLRARLQHRGHPRARDRHAFAQHREALPTLKKGQKVVLNCSGRGDKDVFSAAAAYSSDISGEVDI